MSYVPGVEYVEIPMAWQYDKATGIQQAANAARSADVIVCCVGENSYCETPGNMDDLNLSSNQKTFLAKKHNTLGINMATATRQAKAYYLVESALEDWSGDYVIARTATTGASAGTTYAMAGQNGTSNFSSVQTVTVTDNAISLAEGAPLNVKIEASANGYTLKFGDYYIGYIWTAATGNNYLSYSTTFESRKYEWTISLGEGNLVSIINVNNPSRYLQLNNQNKDRYCGYTGTQWNPSLFRLSGGSSGGTTPPTPQPASATVTTGAAGSLTQNSAVLSGSFSGETGAISEVGFYWGGTATPSIKVVANGTSSPFSYTLSSLDAGTTYYFQAYVLEYNAVTGQDEERTGSVVSFTTQASTPVSQYYEKVVSNRSDWSGQYVLGYLSSETTAIPMTGIGTIKGNSVGLYGSEVAVNSGNIDYSAASAYELTIASTANGYSINIGGKYLCWNSGNTLSGEDTFTATTCEWTISYSGGTLTIANVGDVTRLIKYNESSPRFACYSSNSYSLRSPTLFRLYTSGGGGDTPTPVTMPGYLGCYEMPTLSLSGVRDSGNETWNNDGETTGGTFPKWYEYDLSVSTRKIITHTYKYNNKVYRNYTALVDQTKRCPILTCYVMHKGAYPDNEIGRSGSFNTDTSYDPGIPVSWQSSGSTSDYNNGEGYARGHHCASEDRQTTLAANFQTFYYTNQSPQRQNSFNSGVWSSLESAVQTHAPTGRDTLYVNVGTLFEDNNSGSSNDGGTVGRPSHFYKCLMLCSFDSSGNMTDAHGIAYLYTNAPHTGTTYNAAEFVTTIDAVELRCGFNLFANVPEALQNVAEQQTAQLWSN